MVVNLPRGIGRDARRGGPILLASMLTLLGAVAPSGGHAQELTESDRRARTHFESGRLHFEEGAYDRARDEFQRAWELSERPPLLLNLATSHERLGRYEEAIANIREYLRRMPDDPQRDRLQRRAENLERLQGQRQPQQHEPEPAAAQEEGAPEPAPASRSAGGGSAEGLMIGSIAGFGLGGLGLVSMGIFGGLALAEDGALRDGCGATSSCTPAQVANADTFALVADIGMIAGVVGLGVGVVLLVLALGSEEEAAQSAVVPWFGPNDGGLMLRSRF
jgi:tetratricopeptide (TPR) repeat protein